MSSLTVTRDGITVNIAIDGGTGTELVACLAAVLPLLSQYPSGTVAPLVALPASSPLLYAAAEWEQATKNIVAEFPVIANLRAELAEEKAVEAKKEHEPLREAVSARGAVSAAKEYQHALRVKLARYLRKVERAISLPLLAEAFKLGQAETKELLDHDWFVSANGKDWIVTMSGIEALKQMPGRPAK